MEMRPNMNPLKENQYEKNAQKLKNVRYNKRETHQHTNDDDEQRGEQKKKLSNNAKRLENCHGIIFNENIAQIALKAVIFFVFFTNAFNITH